jgi:hypothetical protein
VNRPALVQIAIIGAFFLVTGTVGAEDTHPFAGFTAIRIGADPQLMAALEGKAEIREGRQTPGSILMVVVLDNQGYASYRDLASTHTCVAWMGDSIDVSGSVSFGLGAARYERQGVRLCSEFSLRKLPGDRVLLDVNGLTGELPIVGHYPDSVTNWDTAVVRQFTLHGRGLGPVGSEVSAAGAPADRAFFGSMANVNLPVDRAGAPGNRGFVRAKYDAAPAKPGGPLHYFWASYAGQYGSPRLPKRSALESGLFGKFGQPSMVTDQVSKVLYLWAHDVSGKLISDPDEAGDRCLVDQELTPRTAVSTFRPGIGPSNCGIMLIVAVDFGPDPNDSRETVAHSYRMELFHGRALARRHAASRMHGIQALRQEIEAKIEANSKMKLEF